MFSVVQGNRNNNEAQLWLVKRDAFEYGGTNRPKLKLTYDWARTASLHISQ